MAFDLARHTTRKHSVTGPEIGFGNLMPINTPITMSNPATSLGRMIKDAITAPLAQEFLAKTPDGRILTCRWVEKENLRYQILIERAGTSVWSGVHRAPNLGSLNIQEPKSNAE
jgi:hypothetical protein